MSEVVGTAKAARWVGLSERAVRALCVKGKLKGAYQPAGYHGTWLIPISTLEAIRPMPEWLRRERADYAEIA